MDIKVLKGELNFKAVRSSGPGGQHVNKTSTKIEVNLDINKSLAFTENEKTILVSKLKNKISSEGLLQLSSSETRSQHRNKTIVIDKLIELLTKSLKKRPLRKKTKPSKNAIEKRLTSKKEKAVKKINRKPPKID